MSIALVPWSHAHAEPLAALIDSVEVVQYLGRSVPYPYDLDDAHAWIEVQHGVDPPLHVAIESDGELAGSIGVTLGTGFLTGSAMIGYYLGRAYWGRGIATAAVRAIVPHALSFSDVVRLWANVMGPNEASKRVLLKAGFTHDATLPRAIVDRFGNRHDEHYFSRFRD